MHPFLRIPVVEDNIEAAGHGYDELLQLFVGVSAAFRAAGYVVEVVDTLDVERCLVAGLDNGQVSAGR